MELIKSYSNQNAVKVIAFAISLEKELSSIEIRELNDNLKENQIFKNDFNDNQLQQMLSMVISQDNIPKQENSIGGIIFQKNDENKKNLWSLIVNKDSLIVTCKVYTRWNEVSKKALEYISIVFDYLNNLHISQITLEYLDEFEILEKLEKWKEVLFQDSCKYITPNIYELNDFWHISQGYFIKLENIEERILDTVDINYFSDELDNLKHKVNMRMQHKLRYETPVKYTKDDINRYFNEMHIHSKELFFKIVHNDILNEFHRGEV